MSLTVRMHNPAVPDGEEFDLDGLGLIKNGGQLTVTDEQLEAYETANGVSLEDALEAGGDIYKVTKTKKGGDS